VTTRTGKSWSFESRGFLDLVDVSCKEAFDEGEVFHKSVGLVLYYFKQHFMPLPELD
jgi:hypothetical protein